MPYNKSDSIAGVLSPIQQQILGFLSARDIVSVEEIAKTLKHKPHVVRYHLNQLLEQGNIRRRIFISFARLGMSSYNFFFNLPKRKVSAAVEFFKSQRSVTWLAENVSERRFELSALARHPRDIMHLFEELGESCGTHIQECAMSVEGDVWYFGLKSLLPPGIALSKRALNESQELVEIDELDYKLLSYWTAHPEKGAVEVARALGLSTSTCGYRLTRLKNKKVIAWEGYLCIGSREKLAEGQMVLRLKSLSRMARERLEECAWRHPYVEALIRCQGDWDYKLLIYGENLQRLIEVEESVREELASVIKSSHLVIRRRRLMEWRLPPIVFLP